MLPTHPIPTKRSFRDRADFIEAAAALLAHALSANVDSPHAVILPGGSTPKPVFDAVASRNVRVSINTHIFYSDERMVPADSPQSNYALSRPLVDAVMILPQRVHPVQTHLGLEQAADALNAEIDAFFRTGGVITLALLGLGADGHTASLFTEADLERATGRWALPTPRPEPPDRVTVTPQTLCRAQHIIFLTTGTEKTDIVEALAYAPETTIAGRAVAGARQVEVWSAP